MLDTSFEEPKLQAILDKITQDEGFKHPKFAIALATKPGDNFIGRIYRTVITEGDDSRSLSLIFKVSPLNRLRQEVLSTDKLFEIEAKVYQIILPTLASFLKKHGVIKSSIFPGTPRCLVVDLADPSKPNDAHVFVLEDKAPEGFRMGNRVKGLDADQVCAALEKLAILHAASLALHHKEPETAERLREELNASTDGLWFNNENHPLLHDLKSGLDQSLKGLKEPYKKGHPVYDKLEAFSKKFNTECVRLNQIPENVPAFNHGDFTTNNLLFKYNEDGVLEDACLIDFQITRVSSPVVDLLSFIFLCTRKAIRDVHYENFLQSYYNKFSSILRSLDCDPEKVMSWDLFQEELRERGTVAVTVGLIALPVFMAESSEITVDVNSADHAGSVFAANVSDETKLEEISQEKTDIINDVVRLGYLIL